MRVSLIGSGNVATALAQSLVKTEGVVLEAIYSRTLENARILAEKTGQSIETVTDNLASLPTDSDLYIISVKDDAIEEIARKFGKRAGVWVHTSGSVGAEVLSGVSERYGVVYPLQTFTKEREVDLGKTPFFVEGSDGETEEMLKEFAGMLSEKVRVADSGVRRRMHIAAVFACNFANYLWSIADDLLRDEGLTLEDLRPLLEETLAKALANGPTASQTGPARRGDRRVTQGHIRSLEGNRKAVYELLTELIEQKYVTNSL